MRAKNLKELHRIVCERDQYCCQLQVSKTCKYDYSAECYFDSNGVNQFLCADHLKTQGSHPELRLETSNAKAVCKDCHLLRHKGQIPEGYMEPITDPPGRGQVKGKPFSYNEIRPMESVKEAQEVIDTLTNQAIDNQKRFICPRGLISGSACKKCQKYIALYSGLCMRCEPFKGHNLKEKKKKKSKN